MEWAVLSRLRHMVPHPNQHMYAYNKGMGTKDSLAAIHSTLDGKDGIIVFMDLDNVELTRREVVISNLVSSHYKETACSNDYLLVRKARGRFQGRDSTFEVFENGKPQGGILSPSLFNLLIANLNTQIPHMLTTFSYYPLEQPDFTMFSKICITRPASVILLVLSLTLRKRELFRLGDTIDMHRD